MDFGISDSVYKQFVSATQSEFSPVGTDEIIIYFAGHGSTVEIEVRNYMVVDGKTISSRQLEVLAAIRKEAK